MGRKAKIVTPDEVKREEVKTVYDVFIASECPSCKMKYTANLIDIPIVGKYLFDRTVSAVCFNCDSKLHNHRYSVDEHTLYYRNQFDGN